MLKGESLQEAVLRKSDKGIEMDGKRDGGEWTDRGLEKRWGTEGSEKNDFLEINKKERKRGKGE